MDSSRQWTCVYFRNLFSKEQTFLVSFCWHYWHQETKTEKICSQLSFNLLLLQPKRTSKVRKIDVLLNMKSKLFSLIEMLRERSKNYLGLHVIVGGALLGISMAVLGFLIGNYHLLIQDLITSGLLPGEVTIPL